MVLPWRCLKTGKQLKSETCVFSKTRLLPCCFAKVSLDEGNRRKDIRQKTSEVADSKNNRIVRLESYFGFNTAFKELYVVVPKLPQCGGERGDELQEEQLAMFRAPMGSR